MPSKGNIESDVGPRKLESQKKHSSSQIVFEEIVVSLRVPNIDLFVPRSNAKCERSVSWQEDPESVLIHVFMIIGIGFFSRFNKN